MIEYSCIHTLNHCERRMNENLPSLGPDSLTLSKLLDTSSDNDLDISNNNDLSAKQHSDAFTGLFQDLRKLRLIIFSHRKS